MWQNTEKQKSVKVSFVILEVHLAFPARYLHLFD